MSATSGARGSPPYTRPIQRVPLGVGVLVLLAGLAVLLAPVRLSGGWAGFILDTAAAPPAPFSLTIEIDPAAGRVMTSDDWPMREEHRHFEAPAEFRLDVRTRGGGEVDITATDSGDRPVIAPVRVGPETQHYATIPVRSETVTIEISSTEGQIDHLDMTTPLSEHDVRLLSAEGTDRYPLTAALAGLIVVLGICIAATAVYRPPQPIVAWSLVVAAGVVLAVGPLWCYDNPFVGAASERPTRTVLLLALAGPSLAALGAFSLGSQSRSTHVNGLTVSAAIVMIPVLIGSGLAMFLVSMEVWGSPSEDTQGIGYALAVFLGMVTTVLVAPTAWMIGRVWRTRHDRRSRRGPARPVAKAATSPAPPG